MARRYDDDRVITKRTACSCGDGMIVERTRFLPGVSWGPWENATEDEYLELEAEPCKSCGNADPDYIVEEDSCAS